MERAPWTGELVKSRELVPADWEDAEGETFVMTREVNTYGSEGSLELGGSIWAGDLLNSVRA
jgi:hypothetical protein